MTDNTDKSVLMKCIKCEYQEYLPEKDLLTLRKMYNLKDTDEDTVLCPFCLSDMYRIDSPALNKQHS